MHAPVAPTLGSLGMAEIVAGQKKSALGINFAGDLKYSNT